MINAAAATRYRPMLEAMNRGASVMMPSPAVMAPRTSYTTPATPAGLGGTTITVHQEIHPAAGMDERAIAVQAGCYFQAVMV